MQWEENDWGRGQLGYKIHWGDAGWDTEGPNSEWQSEQSGEFRFERDFSGIKLIKFGEQLLRAIDEGVGGYMLTFSHLEDWIKW